MNPTDKVSGLMQLGALGLKGATPGGNVGFSRQDGPAYVQINSPLSAEAALKLETFLRDLISDDAPVLEQMALEARKESERQQYAAMSRAQAQAYRPQPEQGDWGIS